MSSIDQHDKKTEDKDDFEVARVWKNRNSSVVVLPQHIAKRYEEVKSTAELMHQEQQQQQQELTTPIAEEQNYSRTINPEYVGAATI